MASNMHNDGVHVSYIYNSTECNKHGAAQGAPCWSVFQSDTGRYLPALCGSRIKKAGFTGTVTALSIRKTSSQRKEGVVQRLNNAR